MVHGPEQEGGGVDLGVLTQETEGFISILAGLFSATIIITALFPSHGSSGSH